MLEAQQFLFFRHFSTHWKAFTALGKAFTRQLLQLPFRIVNCASDYNFNKQRCRDHEVTDVLAVQHSNMVKIMMLCHVHVHE